MKKNRKKNQGCERQPVEHNFPGCGMVGPTNQTCTLHVSYEEFDGFATNWHAAVDLDGRGRSLWRRNTERVLTRN